MCLLHLLPSVSEKRKERKEGKWRKERKERGDVPDRSDGVGNVLTLNIGRRAVYAITSAFNSLCSTEPSNLLGRGPKQIEHTGLGLE